MQFRPIKTSSPELDRVQALIHSHLNDLSNGVGGDVLAGSYNYADLGRLRSDVGDIANCLGRVTANDGGEGQCIWIAGVGVNDGGTIFAGPAGSGGFWSRIFNGSVIQAEWFGAKNDGVFSDTATAGGGGTVGTSVVYISGNPFVAADIGKTIRIDGKGVAGASLVSTIVGINPSGDPTECMISGTVGTAGTGNAFYGSDSGSAINAALLVAHRSDGKSLTVALRRGIYLSAQEVAILSSMSANLTGSVGGDIRNQMTTLAVCHNGIGVNIYQRDVEGFRASVKHLEIYGVPAGGACLRVNRTNVIVDGIRTELGLYGIYLYQCYTSHFSNFFTRRSASHGVYCEESNHNWFKRFQANSSGGHGVYANIGAVNVFDGEYNDNGLAAYRLSFQQSTTISGYFEETVAGSSGLAGIIDDDCVDCHETNYWHFAGYSTKNNGTGCTTSDTQGSQRSSNLAVGGKLTNLQTDSEFLTGVGGFGNAGTQCTVTRDTSLGFLSGHSLKILTDVAANANGINVVASRTVAKTLGVGDSVVVRGWVRASRELYYNYLTDVNQPYFRAGIAYDGLSISDHIFSFYADTTCWRPFSCHFTTWQAATGSFNFNLEINNARGDGRGIGDPQDCVWVTGLELFVIPKRDASVDLTSRGKDWAKMPYVRTFANASQTVNLGAFAQFPVVATADLPVAGSHMDGTVLIENAGAGVLNLVLYGAGIAITK